jgi:eukaryotic-like serine/threonine-protein kinase
VRQIPRPGRSAKAGTPVRVTLSRGGQVAEAPDVMGQAEAAARSALAQAGVEVGVVTRFPSSTVAAGTVMRQSPMPDEGLRRDHPINLLVSSGPPAGM